MYFKESILLRVAKRGHPPPPLTSSVYYLQPLSENESGKQRLKMSTRSTLQCPLSDRLPLSLAILTPINHSHQMAFAFHTI